MAAEAIMPKEEAVMPTGDPPTMPEDELLNPPPAATADVEDQAEHDVEDAPHDQNKENNEPSQHKQEQQLEPTPITVPAPAAATEKNDGDNPLHKNDSLDVEDYLNFDLAPPNENDPDSARNREIITNTPPTTDLERALKSELDRQLAHNELLVGECTKLRSFIAKRKQTYKRKRKDESAPRKKLSGYNLFVRERFAKLARENEEALKSADSGKGLKRIPPASNIASSGHAWSQLSAEEKARYNEMAKPDEDRFEKETATYQAPDRLQNRKRNKTGYNVFFSQHVLKLKTEEGGVPSERGSVARIVGEAWKSMSAEEKDEYERLADRQNEMDPLDQHNQQPPGMDGGVGQPHPHPHDGGMPQDIEMPPPEEHHHQFPPHHPHHPPPHMMEGHPPPPPPPGMEDGIVGGPPPDGGPPPHGDPNAIGPPPPPPMPPGMPPPYLGPDGYYPPPPPGAGGPPPVIHQPPGYDPAAGYPYPPPPYDMYGYPPPPYPPGAPPPPGMLPPPGGMPPPPPGVEGMPPGPYGPPPPNYQGPPPPYG